VTGTADGWLREWELAGAGLCQRLEWGTPAGTLLAFSRLTPRVAYMDEAGGIVVRGVPDGRQLGRLADPGGWIEALSFDRNAERLVGVSQKGTLRAWRWRTGEVDFELELGRRAASMRPSPDGSMIVCALDDGRIQVRDPSNGALLRTLGPSEGLCERVTTSLDGSTIASTHHGNLIRIWEARSGRLLFELGARRPVFSVLFAREGRMLVVGSWDGSIDVWDLATRTRVRTLEGHSQRVNSMSLGEGGSLFASASNDGTVRLWDVGVAHCLATFDAGHGPVRNAVFAPDGRSLVSFHDDGGLEQWDLGCYDRHIAGNEAAQRARLQRAAAR
jgi:WD40 repeat protein